MEPLLNPFIAMNPMPVQPAENLHTEVRGACPHDCPDTCSMVTTVVGGIAIKVQGNPAHPHTDGALCTKVSRYAERSYHPERLLQPLQLPVRRWVGSRRSPPRRSHPTWRRLMRESESE